MKDNDVSDMFKNTDFSALNDRFGPGKMSEDGHTMTWTFGGGDGTGGTGAVNGGSTFTGPSVPCPTSTVSPPVIIPPIPRGPSTAQTVVTPVLVGMLLLIEVLRFAVDIIPFLR